MPSDFLRLKLRKAEKKRKKKKKIKSKPSVRWRKWANLRHQ